MPPAVNERNRGAATPGGGPPPGGRKTANRSEVVRQAVKEFLARHQRREREEQDRRILSAHRDEIERQAAALLAEQAGL